MSIFDVLTVATSLLVVYVITFLSIFILWYARVYSRNKILKFTQEEVKELRTKVIGLWSTDIDDYLYEIRLLIIHFDELAVGINEGLYDEAYIRMVLGHDMMRLYRIFQKMIIKDMKEAPYRPFGMSVLDELDDYLSAEQNFISLELLLKKWDRNESFYRRNGRRVGF
ncbi:MAG: hypothetical protein FWC93_04725 [Defluviitaleaceae bacterium]|nr:hypothetical protein [Defluviitaleaceae bacterium]